MKVTYPLVGSVLE